MKTWIKLTALTAFAFAAGWLTAHLNAPTPVHAAGNRVFELRVYHANPGKLAGLQKLFRELTLPMFKRHGIESIGYWVPQDKPNSENTWIYLIAHPSREEATKNWAAFQADPDWKAGSAAAQADGRFVQKIDSTFLDPAEFSGLK